MTPRPSRVAQAYLLGTLSGAVIVSLIAAPRWNVVHEVCAQQTVEKPPATLQSLAAEIETLKGRVPDQAHAMADVGYHFTNLWFAAEKGNWPLADFYFKETKSHLNWAVRIIPVRKDNAGTEVNLKAILQSIENSIFKNLEQTIASKDKEGFVRWYKSSVESCYSCHKASDKPFIRPQIPTQPETHIINFDPKAKWPQ